MSGTLFLIPTPIDDEGILDNTTFDLLNIAATVEVENSIFVIEDLKPGRRRWLRWKLPRESIDSFVLYNEHSASKVSDSLLPELKSGKNVYLMSDGGMPSFCDPGRELVSLCHDHNIKVTSTPFYNSVILALALSGFNHRSFLCEGFIPRESEERKKFLATIYKQKQTVVLMDTPYRMMRLLEEMRELERSNRKRRIFLATNLTTSSEKLWRGSAQSILKSFTEKEKREFVLIIESLEKI